MVAKIVAAAEQLLAANGPESVTISRIAAAAHISKGSIYQYFETKEEIIGTAVRASLRQESALIGETLETIALRPPEQMLDMSIDYLVEFATARGYLLQYLLQHTEVVRDLQGGFDLPAVMLTLTTMHVRRHRDRYRPDLEPRTIAWLFINSAIPTVLRYIESDQPVPLSELRTGLKCLAHGLLDRPAANGAGETG